MEHSALCKFYFELGASFRDILYFLAQIHGICISSRTLKRHMTSRRFIRRTSVSSKLAAYRMVKNLMEEQIVLNGNIPTPQWLLEACTRKRISVTEETIVTLMQILNPVKSESRLRRKIRRKGFAGIGPDYIWHIDTFYGLQKYGVLINVCMDGFSGYIILANAYKACGPECQLQRFYANVVEMQKGRPKIVRVHTDHKGNSFNDFGIQSPLRHGCIFGAGVEKLWRYIRQKYLEEWSIVCASLSSEGKLHGGGFIQLNPLKRIQNDIDKLTKSWNYKVFRLSRGEILNGIPAIMYTLPTLYGTRNYLQSASKDNRLG